MRIVVDLQGAQSGSRFRGIGRYSLALATAMARNQGAHELHVVLNARFADSIEPIKLALGETLAPDRFHVWEPVRPRDWHANDGVDERLREAFVSSLKPDLVHVSSMFEGLGEPAITSIGAHTLKWKSAVTLFDLIPLIYRETYLADPRVAEWYFQKIGHLRRADLLLGISNSACKEAIDYLGFNPAHVADISSAIDDHFVKKDMAGEEAELRKRFSLDRPFVMYTGGIDHRKNIEGLLRAYASLPAEVRRSYQLAIVCSVTQHAKDLLTGLAASLGIKDSELVMTGFVSDEDLVGLYNLCQLFVFPSWHEGFGLPALEAMQCGAVVIGSNTSSLPEVIGLDEALFDPWDVRSMADKILQGLTDHGFRQRMLSHATGQVKKFSWDESAKKALSAMETSVSRNPRNLPGRPVGTRRPTMAYVSPLPPERSGIADFSAELVPELGRFYDIDVIVDQPEVSDLQVRTSARVRDVDWFYRNAARYERVLYHFGNSRFHVHMCEMLERVPGIAVMHDFFLSGMTAYRDFVLGEKGVWPQLLYRSHGYAPLPTVAAVPDPQGVVNEYPCNFHVLQAASGIIVHSEHFSSLVSAWYPPESLEGRVASVPLARAAAVVTPHDRAAARGALGFSEDAFVISSFGFIAPTKQNHRLLDAWLSSPLAKDERAHLFFVGGEDPNEYGREIERKIKSSGARNRIHITGYTTADDFRKYLLASDVAVQLRTMSRGETSASILDALNYGLPTIINANGAAAEIPDDVVIKLGDEFTDEQLCLAIMRLHADGALRKELADKGHRLIATRHSPRHCAEEYAKAIEASHQQQCSGEQGLLTSIANHLALEGRGVDELALGRALDWVLPPRLPARQVLFDVESCAPKLESLAESELRRLLLKTMEGWRLEPIRWSEVDGCYRYATDYALRVLGCPVDMLQSEPVRVGSKDILLLSESLSAHETGLCLRGATVMEFDKWFDAHLSSGEEETKEN